MAKIANPNAPSSCAAFLGDRCMRRERAMWIPTALKHRQSEAAVLIAASKKMTEFEEVKVSPNQTLWPMCCRCRRVFLGASTSLSPQTEHD